MKVSRRKEITGIKAEISEIENRWIREKWTEPNVISLKVLMRLIDWDSQQNC